MVMAIHCGLSRWTTARQMRTSKMLGFDNASCDAVIGDGGLVFFCIATNHYLVHRRLSSFWRLFDLAEGHPGAAEAQLHPAVLDDEPEHLEGRAGADVEDLLEGGALGEDHG